MGWGTIVAGFPDAADTLQEVDVVTITNRSAARQAVCTMTLLLETCSALPKSRRDLACVTVGDHLSFLDTAPRKMHVQVGIVLWGIGCADPECNFIRRVSSCSASSTNLTDSSVAFFIDPSVYARIEEEFDWIRFQVCCLSNNPSEYFACD